MHPYPVILKWREREGGERVRVFVCIAAYTGRGAVQQCGDEVVGCLHWPDGGARTSMSIR